MERKDLVRKEMKRNNNFIGFVFKRAKKKKKTVQMLFYNFNDILTTKSNQNS